MTIVNRLSVSESETVEMKRFLQGAISGQFNVAVDFDNLTAEEVDFSPINKASVQKMDNALGKRYIAPVKTSEGMDGEVHYVEVNGATLTTVTAKSKKSEVLLRLQESAENNEEFKDLFKNLEDKGYTTNKKEQHILQVDKYLEMDNGEVQTESKKILATPMAKSGVEMGLLLLDEDSPKPVFTEGNQYTLFQEGEGVVTVQGEACYVSWTHCMYHMLGGCSTWQACLLKYGSCVAACCTCANPLSCVGCAICGTAVVGAAWACRYCFDYSPYRDQCPTYNA